jgi:hypothetical protein
MPKGSAAQVRVKTPRASEDGPALHWNCANCFSVLIFVKLEQQGSDFPQRFQHKC